jgi:hypothetical protein
VSDENIIVNKNKIILLSFNSLQERVERKIDESNFVTDNRIQKVEEAIMEEKAKIADIEHVSYSTTQL